MADEDLLQVRSYSVCFRLERRLHKIDRWRIPAPHGIPLKGVGYAFATLAAVIVLSRLPVIGAVLGSLHPVYRYVGIPFFVAWALMRWKIDGRSAAATGLALARFYTAPRRLVAFRAASAPAAEPVRFGPVTIAHDERSARSRRGVIEGVGQIVLRYPSKLDVKGNTLRVTQESDKPMWRGKQVKLTAGQRVVVE